MTYPDSDTSVEATQDSQESAGAVEPQETGTPWAHLLEDLPESVRPLVEPKFREWDAGVTQQFQKVHSQYAPYKEYEPILESGYDVQELQQAIALAEALNTNPEAVYQALVEGYGFGQSEQGQADVGPEGQEEEEYDPRFLQVEQMTQTMADLMTQQYEAQQAAEQDAALDSALTNARQQFGDFDEGVVLSLMHANPNLSLEHAITQYNGLIESQIAARVAPQAPVVMGGGGGLPSQSIDPSKLNEQERKSLVTQWLANTQRE